MKAKLINHNVSYINGYGSKVFILLCNTELPAINNMGLNVFTFIKPVEFEYPEIDIDKTNETDFFSWHRCEVQIKTPSKNILATYHKVIDKRNNTINDQYISL